MSSSPLSSKNNTFGSSQTPFFNRFDGRSASPMNAARYSPGSTTTRIVGPKPFYRSQITPDPYDHSRRNIDYQQYLPNQPQRRSSISQINADDDDDDDDDDDQSTSSDESLSIEFPPPPAAFSTPAAIDETCQFIPVRNPYLQTMIGRSDSGSSLSNSYLSDHESSYRSATPTRIAFNTPHPAINVNASQPPSITITARGSPNRPELRFSPLPNPTKPTFREIRIARPESPSISITRPTIPNQPITYTNGNDPALPIFTHQRQPPVALSSSPVQIFGRTPSPFRQMDTHRDSPLDSRYASNVVANRFKPLLAYTTTSNSAKSPVFDSVERRPPPVANLPPTSTHSNSAPLAMRTVHGVKKDAPDVDHLARLLMKSIHSSHEPNFFGMCARCNDEIVGEENGLVAMDRMYHVSCFTCTMCGCRLRGMHFYSMENKPYCEACYINSLEKCVACARPITDRILRATGKPYHAECFCCVVCRKSLDGVPFTIDAKMEVHCIDCFHHKFAPRCYACHRAILPTHGQDETLRIVALDRNYHLDCYRCEKCKVQFTGDEGCYPVDDHVLCLQCNRLYSRTVLGHT